MQVPLRRRDAPARREAQAIHASCALPDSAVEGSQPKLPFVTVLAQARQGRAGAYSLQGRHHLRFLRRRNQRAHQREFTSHDRSADHTSQSTSVMTRRGRVSTAQTEHVKHRALGFEDRSTPNSSTLDGRHRACHEQIFTTVYPNPKKSTPAPNKRKNRLTAPSKSYTLSSPRSAPGPDRKRGRWP